MPSLKKSIFYYCLIGTSLQIVAQEKTAVFIIGMGRSGTSCLTGILQILGLELGEPLAGPRENNKKGKFEHLPTTYFMQPLLKEIDAIWYKPQLINWQTYPKTEELKNQVKAHLDYYFGKSQFFGIKNPEITILLPLFLEACKELGYTPKIIMALRHPDETNESIKKDLEQPYKDFYRNIALAYACAFKYSVGYDMHVVYFDDLIQNTSQTVQQLNKFLPQLKEYSSVEKEIKSFIDEGLKHHNTLMK